MKLLQVVLEFSKYSDAPLQSVNKLDSMKDLRTIAG